MIVFAKRMNRQVKDWEKNIFKLHIQKPSIWNISRTLKLQLQKKTNNPIRTWAKDVKKHFTEEGKQMEKINEKKKMKDVNIISLHVNVNQNLKSYCHALLRMAKKIK